MSRKIIPVNSEVYILVDDKDFKRVRKFKWFVTERSGLFYAYAKKTYMHRFILDLKKGDRFVCDHIDGNGLNNQRNNLRICTNSQNMMNARKRKDSKNKFKGIYFYEKINKWGARLMLNKKWIYAGSHNTQEAAALAYNILAKKHFGEFARLNNV